MKTASEMGPLPSLPNRTEPPWVETRAGAVFFINAVLAAPILTVALPSMLGWILRALGVLVGPSTVLDPVPAVAAYVAPVVGWLAIPALAFSLYGLRVVDRRWARIALVLFTLGHLFTLAFTVSRWMAG